jgi:transposase
MKALTITNHEVNKNKLLSLAERIPNAWIGIRIAALLLILSGWKSTHVASLFGLSQWSVVKWIQKANREGTASIEDKPRAGRPSRLDENCKRKLEQAIQKSPKDFGIARARWDGIVVVEYLRRFHHVQIRVRRAQQLLHELGYVLKQPAYGFAQATKKGLRGFRIALKKTPSDS